MSHRRQVAGSPLSRAGGRHRRPSRADIAVPAGVTGGMLMASALGGVATAAPAAASEQGAGTSATGAKTSTASASATSSSDSLPALPNLLTRGSTGKYVKLVQERLDIVVDGIYGPQTESAVRSFQRKKGLTVDGIVGPETWGALGGTSGGGSGGGDTKPAGSGSVTGLAQQAIGVAAQQAGDPYRYGAVGPDSFDCSGLVQYVFGKLGHDLPRTTQAQYAAVTHVSRGDLRAGDLVFLFNSSGAYHVGIYAGDGTWWVARHSGTVVTKQQAYWMDGGYDWRVGRVG